MKDKFKLYCLLFLMASCKYEEGPFISLRSPMNRVAGLYTIDCVQENGVNIMSRIDTLRITSFYFGTGEAFFSSTTHPFEVRVADSVTYLNDWFFSGSDDKHLYTGTFGCGISPPDTFPSFQPLPGFSGICNPPTGPYLIWTITKLCQKKMWLEADFNGNHYEVHFKQ